MSPGDKEVGTTTNRFKRDDAVSEELIRDLLPDEDNQLGKAYDSRLLSRLLAFLEPYRWKLILAIFLMITSSLLLISQPIIIARAVDEGIRTGSLSATRTWTPCGVVMTRSSL